ncbi:hypothetical protein CLAFUW4_09970 [Fulvia fulva]|uniref:Uncharacterized protein n=1 Tax=Passalora fulva TaxID=5499 RepID=A0A9Q8UUK3_PASFU|nr:uncharacterized protein CLAFUR5_12273 [Fulvia fulva]KAK4615561.1 hypothetical protein CLAFUR4_09974 [Fulvia fulva]KAK4616718.1 hypothetical protein CLAFUR0_09971 [Fulvia fulva]UJO22887.1 hypothetical protein CLAFUR5_12273 [Fulvia fulva]WPV19623.1 hypothetical protein CLAFUW4_09970 [Fulvia fulva]WPV34685.1 hypothetical protein CLAFUW7_09971 [Fulvia fulva]
MKRRPKRHYQAMRKSNTASPKSSPIARTNKVIPRNERDDNRHIFPFFDLPAELRDEIYDNCTSDHETILSSHVRMITKQLGYKHLLLISRQFTHEHRARLPRKKTVILTKMKQNLALDLTSFAIPSHLAQASDIEIYMLVDTTSPEAAIADLTAQQQSLYKFFPQLRPDQSLTVRMIFDCTLDSESTWRRHWATIFHNYAEDMKRRGVTRELVIHVDLLKGVTVEDLAPMYRWVYPLNIVEILVPEGGEAEYETSVQSASEDVEDRVE